MTSLKSLIQKVENKSDLAAAWAELQNLRRQLAPVFRESLAFVHGALLRTAALDDGLCELGDAIASELSRSSGTTWTGLTIMTWEGESYDDLVELIRIRSPEVSIWSLPIVAHEFGHFAGQTLAERVGGDRFYRFKEYLQKKKQEDARAARHLDELFADLYATYTFGPAYACTAVVLRFDPTVAFQPGLMHPSPDARVYWILKLLQKIDDGAGVVRPYREIIGRLRGSWQATVAAAGQQSPANLDRTTLDEQFDELFKILDGLVPDDAQYPGWLRAQALANSLDPDSEAAPKAAADTTLADVLNAAWLCRLRLKSDQPASVRIIGDRAASLCRTILAAPA
jgi:hypothetical protein